MERYLFSTIEEAFEAEFWLIPLEGNWTKQWYFPREEPLQSFNDSALAVEDAQITNDGNVVGNMPPEDYDRWALEKLNNALSKNYGWAWKESDVFDLSEMD